jgi:hypothetical protein
MLYALLLRFIPRWLAALAVIFGYSAVIILVFLLASPEHAVFRYME